MKNLKEKYPIFCYEKYSYKIVGKNLHVTFYFSVSEINFSPKIIIKNVSLEKKNKDVLDNLIFNLGMIEMFSYWKATASPKILVRAGKLKKSQINWWKDILLNGMGQYFYENKINFTKPDFLEIISESKEDNFKKGKISGKGILIPIGGGKDSAVTLQMLKKLKKDVSCFALNPNLNINKMFKISGFEEIIISERKIEENLLKMNRKGFLNGHTPFVAYLSFLLVLVSYLFNKKYIILSNEDSSNEENVIWLGKKINHQYSKTYDFEKKFRKYSRTYLIENVEYFSSLRILYEIQIALIFSHMKEYFPIFLSCNEANKTYSGTKKKIGNWCCNCSKCLFVYLILYPFLEKKELLSIFGEDLFEKKELLNTLKELAGEKSIKPFECVGTKKEVLVALYLSYKKEGAETLMLKYFEKNILNKYNNWEEMVSEVMDHWNTKNFIPQYFKD
jgi:hypothetical protein